MDYYRRNSNIVTRNNIKIENTFRKVKLQYKIGLVAAVLLLSALLMFVGIDYLVFVFPAILGTTLLIGTIERNKDWITPGAIAILVPILSLLLTDKSIETLSVELFILIEATVISSLYRPFMWKRSVAFVDIPLWLIILMLSVTRVELTAVLVVLIVLKVIIQELFVLSIIPLIKIVVTDEQILNKISK